MKRQQDPSGAPGSRAGLRDREATGARAGEAGRERSRSGAGRREEGAARRWWPWPALVAAAFTIAQLLVVPPGMGLGWDESVYVSQVSDHAPAAFFSAPRARGVPALVWPVAAFTDSTAALRVYLAVASGLALFLVLRVWRGRRPPAVLALAGVLFCGLWVTLFYAPQAMPNLWVALPGLAAVGFFLRAADDPGDRRSLWGLGGCVAVMALMRPTDAVWVVLPLLAAPLLVRRWRRLALPAAVVLGLAAGAAEWVVEAYVSYGGLAARLDRASEIQGGLGWNVAIGDQLRALRGVSLCRPCEGPYPNPVLALWWFALPVAAAGGVALAVRARRSASSTVLLAACGVTSAVPYLFFIQYAAPRFLLPAYALLAIPVADFLMWLARGAGRPGWRPVTATLVGLALTGHLVVQYLEAAHVVRRTAADHRDWEHIADALHSIGVRPPCLLSGPSTIPMAFYAGCGSVAVGGPNANITVEGIRDAARDQRVAVLVPPGDRPPGFAADWDSRTLPGPRSISGYRVYLPPAGGR